MGWFGDLNLGLKYAIVLFSLIGLVFIAGFMKLFYIRQRTRKFQAEAKAKAANEEGKVEQIALNQREEGEGDLFGIRALERGFYGGVAQSRPTTPTPQNMSSSTLVPSAANIPFGQKSAGNSASPSATSSIITIDVGNPKLPQVPPPLAKRSDAAVDMQLNVPDSPKLPRSPESPQFPRSRSPSPLSNNSTPHHLESNIPSSGLGLNGFSSGGPKVQSNKAPIQVDASKRTMTIFSDAASVVDEDSPPGSSNGSQSGPGTNFSRPPPSPPRGGQPQIRIDGPDSPIPGKREVPFSTINTRGVVGVSNDSVAERNGAQLGVDNGNNNNRVSSQSLADVYDSYYDGRKRDSSV